jgi:ABC-type nitrate/sulfonate/bicarbonate transport system substrate-binding protein
MRPTIMIGALACAAMVGMMSAAPAQTALKVIVFPGLSNFSIYAAQHKNLFAKHGLAIELLSTPNSTVLREGLAKGDYQIAQAGVDNSVAMVELAKADAIIVAGGDNGFNHIFVQPEIKAYADLRGKTVVVDAPNTAFALLLYKVLKDNGLNKGDYVIKPVGATIARLEAMTKDKANAAAGVLNPPFTFLARDAGLKDMGATAKAIGAYQSDGVVVMRDWARANSDTLVRYISALIEGRRWALDPVNKEQAVAAAQAYAVATDPAEGMAKDAQLDMAGFRNVLKLRAEIEGQWGGNPPPPDNYLDLSYYEPRAIGDPLTEQLVPHAAQRGSGAPLIRGRHNRDTGGRHLQGVLLRSSIEVSSPLIAKSL